MASLCERRRCIIKILRVCHFFFLRRTHYGRVGSIKETCWIMSRWLPIRKLWVWLVFELASFDDFAGAAAFLFTYISMIFADGRGTLASIDGQMWRDAKSPSKVPTQKQQQLNASNHGPVSKDLLFSNQLLMCLAGNNYNYSDASPCPPLCFSEVYINVTTNLTTNDSKNRVGYNRGKLLSA